MASKVDLSEFYKLSKPKRPPCQVGLVLSGELSPTLGPADRKRLKAALETDKNIITAGAVTEWLDARDIDVSVQRIVNHRGGKCSCA